MYYIVDSQNKPLKEFGSFISQNNALNVLRKVRESNRYSGCRVTFMEENNGENKPK